MEIVFAWHRAFHAQTDPSEALACRHTDLIRMVYEPSKPSVLAFGAAGFALYSVALPGLPRSQRMQIDPFTGEPFGYGVGRDDFTLGSVSPGGLKPTKAGPVKTGQ